MSAEEFELVPLRGIRRRAADRLAEAQRIPAFHLTSTVAMGAVLTRKTASPGTTVTDVIVHACGRTLVEHRELNSHFCDDGLRSFRHAAIGLAVNTKKGLVVPVIRDVDLLSETQVAEQRVLLVDRARRAALVPEDMAGGTFTISNLGMFGIDRFDAILNAPQVAILAVGAIRPALVLTGDGDRVCEQPVADLTLTCDHRAADGAAAAEFLAALRQRLETPCDATADSAA